MTIPGGWQTKLHIFAPGKAQTKGSTRAFPFKRADGSLGASVTNDNPKARDWQNMISMIAKRELAKRPNRTFGTLTELFYGPVQVVIEIRVPRPKSHLKKNGEPKPSAPPFPLTKPDMDKVERVILDALTGIFYKDDAQVILKRTSKVYATKQATLGTWIEVLGWEWKL
jgi:crossover junction endodeoxyribonuclease RusA